MTITVTTDDIQAENATLQQRVVELETALSESQQRAERLHTILETTTDWAWEVDSNWLYTYISPNIATVLGYDLHEVVGKTPFDLMPPEEAERVITLCRPLAAARQPIQWLENTVIHKDGHHMIMQTNGMPFYDENGLFCGYRGVDRDITQWKQAEIEHDQLFMMTPDLICIAGFDGYFKRLNPSWSRLLGFTEEELYAEPFLNFVHPDDQQATLDAAQQLAEGQTLINFTNRYRCKDGSYRWIEWVSTTMAAQQRIYAVARDITERKKQEEDLQHLLASSPVVLFRCKASGDFGATFISENVSHIFGYAPHDFTEDSQFWARNIHPDDASQVFADLGDIFEHGHHVHEYRFQMKDGSYRWIHDQLRLIRDEQGNPVEMVGCWQDITERKQQEEDLRIFKAVIENAIDGIGMANNEGRVTYANASYGRLTGYGQAVIGMALDTVYDADMSQMQTIVQSVIEHGCWLGNLPLKHKNGTIIPVQISVFPVPDEQGCMLGTVAIVRDITEQKQAEAERAALQQQVIDAQQEALRELSTPLIPIANQVLVMPLVGSIDSTRAQMVMETLLDGVAQHQATLVILDITGVQVVDTQVANAFIQVAQAVKLLGAQVVLTGIQPPIAQTLIHLGVDLQGIVTRSTLQAGIEYALGRTARRVNDSAHRYAVQR